MIERKTEQGGGHDDAPGGAGRDPAHQRATVVAGELALLVPGLAQLASAEFSTVVHSDLPLVVDRTMTWDAQKYGGHSETSVDSPSSVWYLAEGATGSFFDLFLLLANPSDQAADVTVTYLLPNGTQIVHAHRVDAAQRYTIWVDQASPSLAETAVSMTVQSTNGVPIVVERSMWWPGDSRTWSEAHNAPGATVTGTAWAVADGEVGDAPGRATYYLIANPGGATAQVKVTLLFADGTPALARTFTVVANSRFGVSVRDEFPVAVGKRFGALIESTGESPPPIVVERAMYADAAGETWAAGTNVLATRLR